MQFSVFGTTEEQELTADIGKEGVGQMGEAFGCPATGSAVVATAGVHSDDWTLNDIGRFMLIEQFPCLPVFFLANGDSQAFIAGRGTHSLSKSKVILGLVPGSEAF